MRNATGSWSETAAYLVRLLLISFNHFFLGLEVSIPFGIMLTVKFTLH